VVERYSNVAIAQAVDVSEAAVRKWLKRWGIKRTRRVLSGDLDELAVSDIRDHLLCGSISRGPENYLFTNEAGRLRDPDHVGNVFRRLSPTSADTSARPDRDRASEAVLVRRLSGRPSSESPLPFS